VVARAAPHGFEEGSSDMPKLKTRSAAKKRFQVKKSGKVKFAKAYAKHLLSISKSPDQKRRNRGTGHLEAMDAKKVIKELFPYGG
jgi:large subunit ribosomal protein L35